MNSVKALLHLLAILCLLGQPVAATTLEELQAQGHLEVNAGIRPDGKLVPGQKLSLVLEVATDRWFSGGTRISIPEVPGLVILQTEQFASNASENRGGQSWVVQRWHLDVYPQRAGEFSIPPLRLRIKVNAGESGDVEGEIYSPGVSFTTILPAGLEGADHWVAAPEFEVAQQFDRSLEDLAVGDAFERKIRFEASDVMAMMLPPFEPREQQGLAAYPSPAQLDNSSNRGQTRASRIQSISYVVEQEGVYHFPAREFFWWHTDSNELQLLTLPEVKFTVGSGASAAQQGGGGGQQQEAAVAAAAEGRRRRWRQRQGRRRQQQRRQRGAAAAEAAAVGSSSAVEGAREAVARGSGGEGGGGSSSGSSGGSGGQ